ncbi:hypothetical protein TWF106_010566 [Orbilia oligospora]|uniref:Tyrosinase copper-binding domain-containing protein n=1 Tax=Orbilia oligospora TaxID=2813651 RepID=A0A7C8USS1_ORBOL|nr:hypothetical protein TWF106_010566 [Orbilia oligospora]
MSALLILPLFIIYFISLGLALAPKTKYVTKSTLIYETVHPIVTVYVTDEAQCSSLGLPLCHEVPWASNSYSSSQLFFLSASDTTAALTPSENRVTTTLTSFHGATTTTTTATKNGAIGESETLNNNSFSTKLNAVNTKNRVLTSQGSVTQSASTVPDTTSSDGPITTITTTESIGEEIDLDPSSSDINIPSSPFSDTYTTVTHHSPFMLESAGSDHFVQFGPEGTIIIGPVIPDPERAIPPMFILHHHGYLTSGDDPNDIVFLRIVDQNQTRHKRDEANEYYKVIHGPKTNISFDDLTSRFSIKDGFLEFFEQGQNSSRFDWYVSTDVDSVSWLFMGPTKAVFPEGFSQIEISKQNPSTSLLQNFLTSTIVTTNSVIPPSEPTATPTTTTLQAIVSSPSGTSSDVLSTSSDNEATSKALKTNITNEDASNDSSSLPLSKSRLTKCPKTPNPTQVWKIVQIIARLDLRNFCSKLLGYKSPATVVNTKAGSTLIVTVNITGDEETEVETSTYYTGTAIVAFSTVYNAGDEPEKRRVQITEEKTVSGVTYLVVDKSSYDGVYGKEDDDDGALTKVDTESNTDADIDYPTDSPDKTPSQLTSLCEIDISEACSQIAAPSEPTTITKTNKGKTLTLPLTDAPTKTETKVLLAASTTTVLNTTQISYPGAGRLTVDSGTYNRWYLYWTGDTLDPALCLLLPSTNATFFITEYRPNMETYRVYANGPDGEKYYMSIAAPIGISAITDYSISLKTLNDINSDEGSVLLYVDLNLENGYVNINTEITGTDRNTMFGCVMVMGKELRAQVRLYAVGDGTVPRECQAWSNLILI